MTSTMHTQKNICNRNVSIMFLIEVKFLVDNLLTDRKEKQKQK